MDAEEMDSDSSNSESSDSSSFNSDSSTSSISANGDRSRRKVPSSAVVHPMNLKVLRQIDVIEFCQEYGLVASSVKCDLGHSAKVIKHRSEYSWRCNKAHSFSKSLFEGTWFEKSRLSILTVLEITLLWIYDCPPYFVSIETEVPKKSLASWFSHCREVCRDIIEINSAPVGGDGKGVEMDESKLGKCHSAKQREDGWILHGLEKETGKCFVVTMPDKTKETLLRTIDKYILPGTIVHTAGLSFFKCLDTDDYNHLTMHRNLSFKNVKTGYFSSTVEDLWSQADHMESMKQKPDTYSAEYLYRKSLMQKNVLDLFIKFIQDIATVYKPVSDYSQTVVPNVASSAIGSTTEL